MSVYPTYPNQVHFLAILHEVPNFGPHLLPHPSKVPQNTKLLEGLIDLQHTHTHTHTQMQILSHLMGLKS